MHLFICFNVIILRITINRQQQLARQRLIKLLKANQVVMVLVHLFHHVFQELLAAHLPILQALRGESSFQLTHRNVAITILVE